MLKVSNPAHIEGLVRGPALGNLTQPQVILSSPWASSPKGLQVLDGRRSRLEINLISLLSSDPPISQSQTNLQGSSRCSQVWPHVILTRPKPRDCLRPGLASLTIYVCLKSGIKRHLWKPRQLLQSFRRVAGMHLEFDFAGVRMPFTQLLSIPWIVKFIANGL